MNDYEKLNCILDYLYAFDEDLWKKFINGNEVTRPIIDAKKSVIDEIIKYVERLIDEQWYFRKFVKNILSTKDILYNT